MHTYVYILVHLHQRDVRVQGDLVPVRPALSYCCVVVFVCLLLVGLMCLCMCCHYY